MGPHSGLHCRVHICHLLMVHFTTKDDRTEKGAAPGWEKAPGTSSPSLCWCLAWPPPRDKAPAKPGLLPGVTPPGHWAEGGGPSQTEPHSLPPLRAGGGVGREQPRLALGLLQPRPQPPLPPGKPRRRPQARAVGRGMPVTGPSSPVHENASWELWGGHQGPRKPESSH